MTTSQRPEQLSRRELLMQGADIVRPVLEQCGFTFALTEEGRGSGGAFAAGCFSHSDRWLELHLRRSLGMVTYHWGDDAISHLDYMAWLGVAGKYPGFSDDPLDGFRHLRADLASATEYFSGTDRARFQEACRWAREKPKRKLP